MRKLFAFAVLILAPQACKVEEAPADLAHPLPLWTVSGSCTEIVACSAGRPVEKTGSSCPTQSHIWCKEGSACNPEDPTPCVKPEGDPVEQSAKACAGQERAATFSYRVLTCSPTGTWRPSPLPSAPWETKTTGGS